MRWIAQSRSRYQFVPGPPEGSRHALRLAQSSPVAPWPLARPEAACSTPIQRILDPPRWGRLFSSRKITPLGPGGGGNALNGSPIGSRPIAPASILEIGCGYGKQLRAIRRRFSVPMVGLDFSLTQLGQAGAYLDGLDQIELALGTGARLPFADQSFDLVLTSAVILHNPRPIAEQMGGSDPGFPAIRRAQRRHRLQLQSIRLRYRRLVPRLRAFPWPMRASIPTEPDPALQHNLWQSRVVDNYHVTLGKRAGLRPKGGGTSATAWSSRSAVSSSGSWGRSPPWHCGGASIPPLLGVYTGLRLYLDQTNRSSPGISLGAVQEIPIPARRGRSRGSQAIGRRRLHDEHADVWGLHRSHF